MHSTDHETGEVTLMQHRFNSIEIDMETGETDSNISTIPTIPKKTFIIPKELYQRRCNKKKKLRCMDPLENYTLFKKEEVISLHEEIILGSNKTSHRLFLIPTVFVCFRFYAVAMTVIEIILHVWAHKKNAKNTNEHVYYRSPLHIFTSQFCASCLHKRQMAEVSKLQEKRHKNGRTPHFKDMTRF